MSATRGSGSPVQRFEGRWSTRGARSLGFVLQAVSIARAAYLCCKSLEVSFKHGEVCIADDHE